MSTEKQTVIESLKALGYTTRMVSVSESYGGYSSTIRATIRHESVNYEAVKVAVNAIKHVDYCESSGEILLGGNTYTDIILTEEVKAAWASHYRDDVKRIAAMLESRQGEGGERTADNLFTLYNDFRGLKIWHVKADRWLDYTYNLRDIDTIAKDIFIANQLERPTAPEPKPRGIERTPRMAKA